MDHIRKINSTAPGLFGILSGLTEEEKENISSVRFEISGTSGVDIVDTVAEGEGYLYQFPVGSPLVVGVYRVRMLILYADGRTETLPSEGDLRIKVEA